MHSFIQYKIFEPFENLVVFTTTKQSLSTINPRFTGNSANIFEKSRIQLAEKLGVETGQLIFPRQTHTNNVVEILEIPITEINETDGLLSNKKAICLCVQTADCVPVLLFDPVKNVIAAVHAGWRGTVKRIVEVVIQKMITNYNSSPKNIRVAIGPSVSPKIYEVGDEVIEAAKKSIPDAAKTFHKNSSGKFQFNLWEANRQALLSCGILSNNIEILGECSFQNSHKYFSARRDGIDTGRMVSGIMILK